MKIADKTWSFHNLSTRLNKLLEKKAPITDSSTRLKTPPDQFNPWVSSTKQVKPFKLEHQVRLDVAALHKFVQTYASQISYQGLIASHLQRDFVVTDRKKNLAIERMVALIEATLADIKSIEANHISRSKG